MNANRLTALLLVAVTAVTMAYMSLRSFVPGLVLAAALVGAMGWVRFLLRRERELIVILVLATVFAVAFRADPYDGMKAHGFFLYPFFYVLGLFALSVMGLKMLVRSSGPLPASLPLSGRITSVSSSSE